MIIYQNLKLLKLSIVGIFLLCASFVYGQSVFDKFENFLIDKNLHVQYGLQNAWYKNSHITFIQKEYDRDIIFEHVQAKDDSKWDKIFSERIGEEQFRILVGIDLSKKYSIFLSATHLAYKVKVDKNYYRNGVWDNQRVSDTILFNQHFNKLEHSNGINIWSVGITRNFLVCNFQKLKLKTFFGISPQIGALLSASQVEVMNPSGIYEHYDPGNKLSGINYSVDFSIRLNLFKHFEIIGNINYFQFLMRKAKFSDDSYVDQNLRGYNIGINLGYRF
jgi:hypothetical protein